MELKLNMELSDFLLLIRNLPFKDKLIIKKQLERELAPTAQDAGQTLSQILLSGPMMTATGYKDYKALKNQFSRWTKKLSV